jgi:hypothetical protein
MPETPPLTDDDVDMLLHEITRQLADARARPEGLSPAYLEALQVAMAGSLAALMRLEKVATDRSVS